MWIYQFVLRFLGPRNQWICKILWIEKRAVPFIFLPEWITDGRYQALVLVLHSLWSNSLMYWYKLFFFTESACFTCCTLLSQLLFFFCTSMLILAKFNMSHLLNGLGQSTGTWEPWWNREESGPNWYLAVIFGTLKQITGKWIFFSDLLHLLNLLCCSNSVLFPSIFRVFV